MANVVNVAVFTNVVGYHKGAWLSFDNRDTAIKVMDISDHHNIFTDVMDMQARFPGGIRKYEQLARTLGAKSGDELWAKILLNSYNPQRKYDEHIDTMTQKKSKPIRRYKKKVAYLLVFDPNIQEHFDRYARQPPQACALLDIMFESSKVSGTRVFPEGQLYELLENEKAKLNTRQTSARIWQYYRGTLISYGFIRYAKPEDK